MLVIRGAKSQSAPSLSRNQAARKVKVEGSRRHSRNMRISPRHPSAKLAPRLGLCEVWTKTSACGGGRSQIDAAEKREFQQLGRFQ